MSIKKVQKKFFLLFSLTSLFLIFGSRYYIGGDYYGYMNLYNKVAIHGFHYGYKQVEFLYFTIYKNLFSKYFNLKSSITGINR